MKRLHIGFIILTILFCFLIIADKDISANENLNNSNNEEIEIISDITENEFFDIQNAALYLKNQMIDRNPMITIIYRGVYLEDVDVVEIKNLAIQHNGIPNEGDYIWHHCLSYDYQYYHYTDELGIYTEITYNFKWLTTYDMEQEMNIAVENLLEDLNLWNASNYEKVKGVYDYICDNVKYDYEHLETEENQVPHK